MPRAPSESPVAAFVVLIVAVVAAAAIVFGALAGFGWLTQLPGFGGMAPGVQEAVLTIVLFGALLLVALGGLYFDGVSPAALIGPQPARTAPAGVAMGLAGVTLCVVFSAIAGRVTLGHGALGLLALPVGLLLVLFQASAEEVYFRGWLQPALQRGWGRWPGIAVASIAFSALHMIGGEISVVSMLNLLLGGFWFGLLADRSGGIVLPAAAHFAWNWGEASIYGLAPNPGVGNYGTLVDLDMTGSALWGGSAEGLNASLGMSFVLVALLILVVTWHARPACAAPVSSPAPHG